MQNAPSDRKLLLSYLDGDEGAFASFYARHRRQLYVYLLSIVGNRETAEELLQDAFLVFLRNLDAIIRRSNGNLNFRGYLVRSARNHAYDELRRRRRADRTITARANDPLFRASDFADTSEDTSDEVHKISANLRLLPKEQREAVVLRALTDLTFREIAQLVGAPENTIVSRYRYGLSKLREQLGAHCGSTTVGTLGSCHERNAKS